ncbi:hypothetical protein LMIY3S_05436 [Labrys miyagiensis]
MNTQITTARTADIQMIGLVLTVILNLVDKLTDNQTVERIVALLEQWLPTILAEAQDLVPTVQGIIETLQGNDALTPDQAAAIDTLNAQADTDFEAAAAEALKGA